MGARKLGDYPRNLGDFYRRFPDDAACFRYLVETRWTAGNDQPGRIDGTPGSALRIQLT
jgi:hypothetical protein